MAKDEMAKKYIIPTMCIDCKGTCLITSLDWFMLTFNLYMNMERRKRIIFNCMIHSEIMHFRFTQIFATINYDLINLQDRLISQPLTNLKCTTVQLENMTSAQYKSTTKRHGQTCWHTHTDVSADRPETERESCCCVRLAHAVTPQHTMWSIEK